MKEHTSIYRTEYAAVGPEANHNLNLKERKAIHCIFSILMSMILNVF